ncbi:hypothetical protein EQH57_0401 [Dictyocoela roeselum]|nr:hypothetical protein EQH57_0401 [Dictyocoela roeselum]
MKFESIITDNGREFANKKVKEWADKKGIIVNFSIPYYHPSNGRVERLNRSIRDGLKKTPSTLKNALTLILDAYNNKLIHRGLGVTPANALLPENRLKVLSKSMSYKNEFKNIGNLEIFEINQKVLIRNETKSSKMDKEFYKLGHIVSIVGNNSYIVKVKDKTMLRHSSQLKAWPGNVGCFDNETSRLGNTSKIALFKETNKSIGIKVTNKDAVIKESESGDSYDKEISRL